VVSQRVEAFRLGRSPCSTVAVMWVPRDLDEVEHAIASGALEETAAFDGKRELPPSTSSGNKSIAVDVAAMSTAGGSILYGVGEDEHERLTVRNPIDLRGAADRIAQVVQTAISEVPHVALHPYALADDPSLGFLLVLVPPSPRAPHQVTVGDDRRFYGRGARGNRRLSEQEVAQLYARRQQEEVNLLARLDEVVRFAPPYESEDPDAGFIHAFAQPVPPDQHLWEGAAATLGGEDALRAHIADAARRTTTTHEYDPSFTGRGYWRRQGADEWRLCTLDVDPPPANLVVYAAEAHFNIDGRAVLFSGNAAQRIEHNANDVGRKMIFERVIAGNLAAFLAGVGALYEAAGYHGPVDVGVAVTNLDGGYSVGRTENQQGPGFIMWDRIPTYSGGVFTRTRRLAAALELREPQTVTMSLLGRFLAASTGRADYTPFP
jgi:hypothetical protein